MIPATYNFDQQYGGDTMAGVSFAFSIDLTDVQAEFAISLNKVVVFTARLSDGITRDGNTLILAPITVPNPTVRSGPMSRATFQC
jgi:hypothetical protein